MQAGPRHPLGIVVIQREGRGAYSGRKDRGWHVRPRGSEVGFLPWNLSSGSGSLTVLLCCTGPAFVRALGPRLPEFCKALFLCPFLSSSCVPAFTYSIPFNPHRHLPGKYYYPILWGRKLRFREVRGSALGRTAPLGDLMGSPPSSFN